MTPADRLLTHVDHLRSLGFGELQHDSHVPFLSHLIGTRRVLASWDSSEALCDAGLFHSVYGTEYFQPPEGTPSAERDEVRALIGHEAERLAWLWCTIERDAIDVTASTVPDRTTGATIGLTERELADIATLWAADTVEQVERMKPDERGFAHSLPEVLPFAAPAAIAAMEPLLELLSAPG
ncbi:MAG: DUF6817 domain-containing protein [Actinomycetota bacterium]